MKRGKYGRHEERTSDITASPPRSPTACAPPLPSTPHLRTPDPAWSRRHSAYYRPPDTPVLRPRLSAMLRGHTLPVNQVRGVCREHAHGLASHFCARRPGCDLRSVGAMSTEQMS